MCVKFGCTIYSLDIFTGLHIHQMLEIIRFAGFKKKKFSLRVFATDSLFSFVDVAANILRFAVDSSRL